MKEKEEILTKNKWENFENSDIIKKFFLGGDFDLKDNLTFTQKDFTQAYKKFKHLFNTANKEKITNLKSV